MIPRTRQQWRRRQWRKQKRQRAWENLSDGGGGGMFTVLGNWWRRCCWRRKICLRTQRRRKRCRQKTRNIRRVWGIGYNDGGGGGSMTGKRNIQWQLRCRRRIYNSSTGLGTTAEVAAAKLRARSVGNNNGVSIFLAIASLTVTLSCLCRVAVSFWYCFHQIPFLPVRWKKDYQYYNHVKNIFVPSVH